MASKQPLKTTFDVEHVIRPIFTGGSVSVDNGAKILATVLGEDAILTDPSTGKHLAQVEGVCAHHCIPCRIRSLTRIQDGELISTLTCMRGIVTFTAFH